MEKLFVFSFLVVLHSCFVSAFPQNPIIDGLRLLFGGGKTCQIILVLLSNINSEAKVRKFCPLPVPKEPDHSHRSRMESFRSESPKIELHQMKFSPQMNLLASKYLIDIHFFKIFGIV